MKLPIAIFAIVAAIGLIAISSALYTVDQREQAIVLQLGSPVGAVKEAGLHVKIPFVQEVRRFDKRVLSVDPQPEQMVISSSLKDVIQKKTDTETGEEAPTLNEVDVSGEPIIVDTFARYRIVDPLMFMKTLRNVTAANRRLESIMNDTTRAVLGNTTLTELLSSERANIMNDIKERVNKKTNQDNLGIEIIDIRIVRADLTPDLRQSTVRRMISELQKWATETRAKGEEQALEIRSTAEKERTVLLAQAGRDSQILRGEGDKGAIITYTKAFNKDKEFYSFIRSMEAYKKTLANPETRMILSPNNEFFKHFQNAQ